MGESRVNTRVETGDALTRRTTPYSGDCGTPYKHTFRMSADLGDGRLQQRQQRLDVDLIRRGDLDMAGALACALQQILRIEKCGTAREPQVGRVLERHDHADHVFVGVFDAVRQHARGQIYLLQGMRRGGEDDGAQGEGDSLDMGWVGGEKG